MPMVPTPNRSECHLRNSASFEAEQTLRVERADAFERLHRREHHAPPIG